MVDVGWAFMVARGWGCGPFIDATASSGDPPRAMDEPGKPLRGIVGAHPCGRPAVVLALLGC
jgi:hypothetical protein